MTPDGYPAPRTRAELRAVLRQEAAYVRVWLCDCLPVADQPRAATDPRWLGDEVAAALEALRAPIGERGLVAVWPEELPALAARDVPPGVRVVVEGYGQGVVRRGTAAACPFVVDANLGESATSWEGVLGVASYVAIVGAAAARRAHEVGDLEILDDAERSDAAPLQVRLRLRDRRLDGAFRAAQAVFAALRAPARCVEEAARREVDRALAALTA